LSGKFLKRNTKKDLSIVNSLKKADDSNNDLASIEVNHVIEGKIDEFFTQCEFTIN